MQLICDGLLKSISVYNTNYKQQQNERCDQ